MPLAADIVFQLRANNAVATHRTCIPSWIDVVGDCSPDDVERAFILGRRASNLRADIHSCEPEVIRAVSKNFVYQGTELDLFSKATHWKAYWGTIVAQYLGERVLEVGAGSGTTARLLCKTQHKSWLALEPDAHLAKQIARDKEAGLLPAAVSVQVGTLAGLEQSANFDTILYIDVLEHIAGDRTELQLAFNFLAPGGFLIVLAPAHQFPFYALRCINRSFPAL